MKKTKQVNNGGSKLKVIPLGGLEQIGLNITAFEYEDSIVVVDCGLSFPDDDMLGIDMVIPDITYLKENVDKVKGFVITHGHEDHIGALPYVLKQLNIPVYATRLTMGIPRGRLSNSASPLIWASSGLNSLRQTTVLWMRQLSLFTPRRAPLFIQGTLKWIIHRYSVMP